MGNIDLLLVFLGNPGKEYKNTRHNIPWLVSDQLCREWNKKFNARIARYPEPVGSALCLKPETYMNLSGKSVVQALQFYKLDYTRLLVVHDDTELPFGVVDLKMGGGHAGHKGLRSISGCLGENGYQRLRLGIGRPSRGALSSHVLGRFSPEEELLLDEYLRQGVCVVDQICTEGFENAASIYQKKAVV